MANRLGTGISQPVAIRVFIGLVLAFCYLAVYRPMQDRIGVEYRKATNLWDRLIRSNQLLRLSGPYGPTNFQTELRRFQERLTRLQNASARWIPRTQVPSNVWQRAGQPFRLLDYQLESAAAALRLVQFAKTHGVALQPGVTNGLPRFTGELSRPEELWLRLYLAEQLLRTFIVCKPDRLMTLQQLPPTTRGLHLQPIRSTVLEFPMYLEVEGDFESLFRAGCVLPLTGQEAVALGWKELTNKPALFLRRVFLRKAAPEVKGRVRAELVISGFVTWPMP